MRVTLESILRLVAVVAVTSTLGGCSGSFQGQGSRSMDLKPNQADPVMESVSIFLDLPKPGDVEVEVFDASGTRVWNQPRTAMPAGDRVITWNLDSNPSSRITSGTYFVRVSAETDGRERSTKTLKMAVVR